MAFSRPVVDVVQSAARNPMISRLSAVGNHLPSETGVSKGRATLGMISRPFHSTRPQASNSILNLSGLSTSRESRFLSKERGIPRTEFSPHLELIRSSEVDPFKGKESQRSLPDPAIALAASVKGGVESYNLNYLLEELENARIAQAKSEEALKGLQATYARSEKETAIALIVLFLALGFYFSEELRHILTMSTSNGPVSLRLHTQPRGNPCSGLEAFGLEEHAESIPVSSPAPRSIWSRLLWASLD